MAALTAVGVIQAGLVFAASMAWADAINTTVKKFYPGDENKVIQVKIIYAIIVTIVVLLLFAVIITANSWINGGAIAKLMGHKEDMILQFAT